MDTNQVGSINFDANNLYLEDESEHEDEKQQDNELKELISQGGLDNILDDDSFCSDDDDDDDDSDSNNNAQVNKQQQQLKQTNSDDNPARNDEQLFSPKMNPPNSTVLPTATPLVISNNNYQLNDYRNQFSTPSTNQMPPLPSAQMLQATVIPNICEEKLFYQRQRQITNQPAVVDTNTQSQVIVATNNSNTNSDVMPKFNSNPLQQPPVPPQPYPQTNETINYTNQFETINSANYLQLQQQHYVPHSKLHTLERFAVPNTDLIGNNLMPNPAPQRLLTDHEKHTHEHLTNDPELSLNVTDNEDDDFNHKQQLDVVTPTTINNKYPIASFGNGIQLEFSGANTTETHDVQQVQLRRQEETSVIDLNELDENQLNQLRKEEEKHVANCNLTSVNQELIRLQFLYKVRGKKLEEVENRYVTFEEEMSRELRASKHRLSLAEQENEKLQSQLNQTHELCNRYIADVEQNKKTICDLQDKNEKLKQTNRVLEQKLNENEQIIENLQMQISEQQKLDTMERIQEQHEHFVEQIRSQYDKDLIQMKETINELQTDLADKHNVIHVLQVQLDTAAKNAEQTAIERTDTINRLTKNLNDLQAKYDQDIILTNLSTGKKINLSKTDDTGRLDELRTEIDKLNNIINNLESEKVEMNNEIKEQNIKIDHMMEQDEKVQQIKNNLEIELYNKEREINECKILIEQLHQSNNNEQINQEVVNNYEAELSGLRCQMNNQDHEIKKLKELYLGVCEEKNNLHETLKQQYDQEYEFKLKQRIELAVSSRLEEQSGQLRDKWQQERLTLQDDFKRQLDQHLKDLKQCREQLFSSEKQFNQLRVEKSNLDIKTSQVESELKEKIQQLQKLIDDLNTTKNNKEFEYTNEISSLKLDLAQCNDVKLKLNDKLAKIEIDCSNLINEKNQFINQIEQLVSERDSLRGELDSFKSLKSSELNKAETEINDLKLKLETNRQQILKLKADLNDQHDQNIRDLEANLSKQYEDVLNETQRKLEQKINDLIEIKNRIENEKQQEIDGLKTNLEEMKQEWQIEKKQLVVQKDEELQSVIKQLEKRFEEDYSTFMQKHKESFQKTLNEKTLEFSQEKETFTRMYEKKINDLELNEKTLMQKIRDLKSVNSPLISFNKSKLQQDAKCQTENEQNDQNEETLHEKIKSLEQIIANADLHFEQEIDKLKQDLESEYQIKLERMEINQRQLENEIDLLRSRSKLSKSSNGNTSSDTSSIHTDSNDTPADFDLIYSSNTSKTKYSKLKQELNNKEKEIETVEQAYRIKLEQLQENYEANLKHMQAKHDTDLSRVKIELNDNYKKELSKSRNEIEQMQIFVQKLKKTNVDSDRVIESLKQEMAKIKEAHLDELASMKLNLEREKENLKEKLEQSQQRLVLLEQRLSQSDEQTRKQCDLLRTELKQEYGAELSKMNSKMKEMMRSHTNSIEQLKKQHQNSKSLTSYQNNKTSQTETTIKDIEMLESFRQRYLETVTRMKSDMLKQFDVQTQRANERSQRQINEERTLVYERLHQILLPKIIDLLREYRISETLIDLKISELELDLKQITTFNISKKSEDIRLKSRSNSPINSLANNYINSLASPRNPVTSELYSKSTSSIKDMQIATSISITNNMNHKTDSIENLCDSTSKKSSSYKYTPLRQSCSNLNQFNQLSPSYSITSNSSDKFKSPRVVTKSPIRELYKSQENLKSLQALNDEDKSSNDYVYFNDDSSNETNTEPVTNTNFYKKYRTQNIRQKKIKQQQQTSNEIDRPQSASSLLTTLKSKSSLHSSSATDLNPIGTLYERSKNFKSLKQLEDDDQLKSNLVSRSSTHLSNLINETPTKLDAEKVNKPPLRSAQLVVNNVSLTRPASLLSTKSISTKSSSLSSSSSTRSRNRSRTPTSTSSSNNDNQSYRQPTVASSNRGIDSVNQTMGSSSSNKSTLSTTSSTQYLPINIQKKKTIF